MSVHIVAELSGNHNNDLKHTKDTIYAMKESGADAVKIQTYKAESLSIDVDNKEFGPREDGPWKGMKPYDVFKKGALPYDWHEEIFDYCKQLNIDIFSSPFDVQAVDFLESLNCSKYKVASFEINHIPLLQRISETKKPVVISTGIAKISEIERAISYFSKVDVTILKCTSAYPAKISESNLLNMIFLRDKFKVNTGLSDHTLGIEVALAAASLGASLIEKHFILDKKLGGIDSAFSMEPKEFKKMVSMIRTIESSLGSYEFKLSDGSLLSRKRGRKIYIIENVQKDEIITEKNISIIRGSHGIEPIYYYDILGKKFVSDFQKGEPLTLDKILDN